MSFWVELHCDTLGDGVNACGEGTCLGKNGNQLGEMASNAHGVTHVLRYLKAEALRTGWKYTRGQWTCPPCVRLQSETKTGATP